MNRKYRLFGHTADVGVEIFGKTRKELFANSVAALFDLMIEQKASRGKASKLQIMIVEGSNLEDLLINFLREALYLFNGRQRVVTDCRPVEIDARHIVAQLSGERYDARKYKIKMEIKAVTYHGMSVERVKSGWRARVIFEV